MSKAEKLVWEVLFSPPERMTNSICPFPAQCPAPSYAQQNVSKNL